ncbi:MAG: non-hydrolyzing UDP-N-acetylglucosamine 2-epimerase [Candidatus Bathyarchaeia archaeon]|jgi:UDP-N-acetylglucosamine 2-epimerase (non-hydrolysing)
MKQIVVVTGTRPEIIKMAPVIRRLQAEGLPYVFVHCGQHYDYNMAEQFIENLELPAPNFNLKIDATSPAGQTADILKQFDHVLSEVDPSIVLTQGDTNTVLATSLAANKRMVKVGHVEAGLRSFDLRMPEEHNRRLTDHISNYLFAPTPRAKANLEKESIWGKIFVTGNTVIDAVDQHLLMVEKKATILNQVTFEKFALATAHRAENVDDLAVLETFMEVFAESPLPIVYPMHPRTKKRLQESNLYNKVLEIKNVLVLPPLGYLDFLALMRHCSIIITDSGGIQEEATAPNIRKPVLVMRLSTERPEAVEAGFAKVVGTQKKQILSALNEFDNWGKLPSVSPFGDGSSAKQIVDILKKEVL